MTTDTELLELLAKAGPQDAPWLRWDREIATTGPCDGCAESKPLVAAYMDPSGENEPWLCAECSAWADLEAAAVNALPDLLGRAQRAEAEVERLREALDAIGRERNTWARQLADMRDERDAACDQAERAETARCGAQNAYDALRVNIELLAEDSQAQYEASDYTETVTLGEAAERLRALLGGGGE